MRNRVLVAGATGYLGQFVIKELKKLGYWVRALCRDDQKLRHLMKSIDEVFVGDATQPVTIKDVCTDIDIVFSSLGITKQKDGFTHMQVDFQANKNILNEALAHNVSTFIYISVFNAEKLKHLEIVKAKEKFVEELKASGIDYIIIRPNGFFSDITEVFKMAKKGRVYLLGNGQYKANPIHGADLAEVCINNLDKVNREIDIGGPEILTQNEIVEQAFEVLEKNNRITRVPAWVIKLILKVIRTFTSVKTYGSFEFFMTVLTMDMIAPKYGHYTIKQHFKKLKEEGLL